MPMSNENLKEFQSNMDKDATIAAQQQQIEALREGLGEAVATIKAWHNMGTKGRVAEQMWELYQQSPEMKRINAALLAVTPQADPGKPAGAGEER